MRFLSLTVLATLALGQAFAQSTQNVVLDEQATSIVTQDGQDTRRVIFVDYDGDLDLGLYSVNYDQPNALYENLGGGTFQLDTDLPNALFNTTLAKGAAFGDVDNDGDQDGFLANGNNRPNTLLINQGNLQGGIEGRYVSTQAFAGPPVGNHSYDAAFGDLDGDGNLDLVVVNRFQLNDLYWGDGSGAFTQDTVQPIALDAGGSRDVELGDLDNDGDLDVYVANGPAEVNFLYANDSVGGTPGSFTRLTSDPSVTGMNTSYGAALGDLDQDGLLDLLVLNRDEPNELYENVSAGGALAFQPVTGTVLDGDVGDSYDASLGDLDADGDVDIVVANRLDSNFVYLATGEAEFDFVKITEGQAVAQRGDSRDVITADLDADGFPEVVFANTLGGDNFLYDNLGPMWSDLGLAMGSAGDPTYFATGQLASNQPVVLTVENAPANALALFVTGLTTSFVPFRGGVIVPTPDIIGPALVTDAQGRLELPSQMPGAVPSALPLFLQALIQDNGLPQGVAFTNGLQGLTL